MRVAIVAEHVDARRGGAETSVLEMADCLSRLGADVSIISVESTTNDPTPARESQPPSAGDAPRRVRLRASGLSKLGRTRAFIAAADEHCSVNRYDVVHAVTPCRTATLYQPRGGTYAETVRRSVEMATTPAVRWVKRMGRRMNLRQQYLLTVERELLTRPRPPMVAAVSEYVRSQVLGDFPSFPPERVRVVFNGVDFKPLVASESAAARRGIRAKLGIGEQTGVAVFIAHNFRLKGLAELVRTASRSGVRWEVIVAGRDRPREYQELAERLGVSERIHFVGAAGPIAQLLAASDLLVHPTWYDPCSRVVLEAICAGLPVVTTRLNGAAEALIDGVTGVVVDSPADESALASAIERCLHPGARSAAAAAAPGVRERLSMMRHARELLETYREVTAKA